MRLIYIKTGEEVVIGDQVTLRDGEVVRVAYFRPPHKASSSGKVSVEGLLGGPQSEYYVSVIGAEWVDREDRADPYEFDSVHGRGKNV